MSSLTCIIVMVLVLKLWKPKTIMRLEGDKPVSVDQAKHTGAADLHGMVAVPAAGRIRAVWGEPRVKAAHRPLDNSLLPACLPTCRLRRCERPRLMVPGLHNLITRIPPVTPKPSPYAARLQLNWLSASGTACFLATIATALSAGAADQVVKTYVATFKQLALPMVTIACMLGLAYLMNYSGMTSTLGLALAAHRLALPVLQRRASAGWVCS